MFVFLGWDVGASFVLCGLLLTLSDNGQNLGQNTGCGSEVGPTGENSLGGVMSVGYRDLH